MKQLICLFAAILLLGCAVEKPYLSPEGYKIKSISDTTNCEIIKGSYIDVSSQNMTYYLQYNTEQNGGNAYKITNIRNKVVYGDEREMVNFEIYKCNK
jgi:hypothetical protein